MIIKTQNYIPKREYYLPLWSPFWNSNTIEKYIWSLKSTKENTVETKELLRNSQARKIAKNIIQYTRFA